MMQMDQLIGAAASANCQGSRVPSAQAEKALSSALISPTSAPCGQSSNLYVLRLDDWNPHKHWLRQPPNLANLHARTRTRIHARIRVRVSLLSHRTKKQVGEVGRLAGLESMRVSAVQPFVLPSCGWTVKGGNDAN